MSQFRTNIWLLFAFLMISGIVFLGSNSLSRWEELAHELELRQKILVRQWFGGFSSLLSQQDAILTLIGEHVVALKEQGADSEEIQQTMDKVMLLNPELFSGFALISPKGEVLQLTSNLEGDSVPNLLEQPESRESFLWALDSTSMIPGRTYYAPSFVVPARKAIRDDGGNVVAVMTGAMSVNSGSGFFGNHSVLGVFNKITILRERDRYIQYATDGNLIDGFHEEPMEEATYRNLIQALSRGAEGNLQAAMANQGLITFTRQTDKGQGRIRGVAVYSPQYEFWLISEVENDYLVSKFLHSFGNYMLVWVLFFSIVFVLFRYIEKTETRRRDSLKFQANHDVLTHLPNRHYLVKRFDHWSASSTPFSLLFVDLDSFKGINDNFGHSVGDELLIELARRFSLLVDDDELLFRHGGDEFVLLATSNNLEQNEQRLSDLIYEACGNLPVDGMTFTLGCSIGISRYPEHGTALDELLRAADIAMYEAKKSRNCQRVYHPDFDISYVRQNRIEQLLHSAVERDEVYMNYQPQVDTEGKLVGVEALVRWKNTELGFVPPNQFIWIAEQTGQMGPLGDFIISRALSEVAAIRQSTGVDFSLSINISVRQFAQQDFAKNLVARVRDAGFATSAVVLEITESTLIEDLERVQRILGEIRLTGIRTSLDDFGTGYSSLSILRDLQFDELKIDKRFVDHIIDDVTARKLIENIISIGHNYGMTVLAEGVESAEQLDLLKASGCDLIQGYFFSRPLSADALESYIRNSD